MWGEDAQHLLDGLRGALARGEGRPEPPLEARDHALDLQLTLGVERPRKSPPHGASVGRGRPAVPGAPPVPRDGGRLHP